jgi:hypothetical protein
MNPKSRADGEGYMVLKLADEDAITVYEVNVGQKD